MNDTEPTTLARLQQRLDLTTVRGGLAATVAALVAGVLTRDASWSPPVWLLVTIGLLFLWCVVTLIGRLLFVRTKDSSLAIPPAFWHWWGARLAIFFAAPILFFCWLIALPAGSPWSGIAGRALILTLFLNFLLGLIGYAAINSALLLERLRRRN